MAKAHNTNLRDLRLNRAADKAARDTLQNSLSFLQKQWGTLTEKIFLHQKRLCEVAVEVTRLRKFHLDCDTTVQPQAVAEQRISVHPFDLTMDHSTDDFASCLPKWTWFPIPDEYQWTTNIDQVAIPRYASVSCHNLS